MTAAAVAVAVALVLRRLLLPPPPARIPDAPDTADDPLGRGRPDANDQPPRRSLGPIRIPGRRPSVDAVETALAAAAWCEDTARRVRSGDTLRVAADRPRPPAVDADRRLLDGVLADLDRHGGASAEVLDRCAERLRARAADRREIRLQSAPARLSARVMTLVPMVTLALLTATNPGVRAHLATTAGLVALTVGGGLNLVGWRWMRRLIGRSAQPDGDPVALLAEPVESIMLAVRSGRSLGAAVDGVVDDAAPAIAPHLIELRWRLVHGWTLADALAGLGDRLGPRARAMIDGLVAAERYGGPLTTVLDRMVTEIDADRRDRAARLARTLPVRLSAPLVTCTLPSFVLIALAPAIAAALASLRAGPLATTGR
jgi:Flp pilus assembly protein TadB